MLGQKISWEDRSSKKKGITMSTQEKSSDRTFNGIVLSIPKKYAYPHHFTTKEGEERVVIKLPPHMPEMDALTGRFNPSGMALFCSPAQLKSYENDPGYYSVILPSQNSHGAAWEVKLHWSRGHWEHPDSADDNKSKGNFIVDDEGTETVSAQELSNALQARREATRKFASSSQNNKNGNSLHKEGTQSITAAKRLSGVKQEQSNILR